MNDEQLETVVTGLETVFDFLLSNSAEGFDATEISRRLFMDSLKGNLADLGENLKCSFVLSKVNGGIVLMDTDETVVQGYLLEYVQGVVRDNEDIEYESFRALLSLNNEGEINGEIHLVPPSKLN